MPKGQGRLRTKICSGCREPFQCRKTATRFCSRSCGARSRLPSTYGNRGVKKGTEPWNKGINYIRPDYRHSEQTRQAISRAQLGNGRPRKTPENYRLRRSERYRVWRKAVFERDDYRCQAEGCGARSTKGCRVEIQAHHIKEFALYPELRFEVSNGLTLCRPCHIKTESFGKQTGQAASSIL